MRKGAFGGKKHARNSKALAADAYIRMFVQERESDLATFSPAEDSLCLFKTRGSRAAGNLTAPPKEENAQSKWLRAKTLCSWSDPIAAATC
jgi:hypothetical protein